MKKKKVGQGGGKRTGNSQTGSAKVGVKREEKRSKPQTGSGREEVIGRGCGNQGSVTWRWGEDIQAPQKTERMGKKKSLWGLSWTTKKTRGGGKRGKKKGLGSPVPFSKKIQSEWVEERAWGL